MRRLLSGMVVLVALAGAAWAANGAAIYAEKCKVCHSAGGVGGPGAKGTGGPLDTVGSTHNEVWLRGYLKDPNFTASHLKMPKVGPLSDDDVDALVAYLLTLKKPGAAK